MLIKVLHQEKGFNFQNFQTKRLNWYQRCSLC